LTNPVTEKRVTGGAATQVRKTGLDSDGHPTKYGFFITDVIVVILFFFLLFPFGSDMMNQMV
jgi:hypothetical protein